MITSLIIKVCIRSWDKSDRA